MNNEELERVINSYKANTPIINTKVLLNAFIKALDKHKTNTIIDNQKDDFLKLLIQINTQYFGGLSIIDISKLFHSVYVRDKARELRIMEIL